MNIRRNLFLLLAATIISAAILPTTTYASTKTSASSAKLADLQTEIQIHSGVDNRAKILKAYLKKYDSPLADNAATFVKQADKYNIDWKLVPAITGVESYFGHMIPPYSYNGWGYHVYNGNVRSFTSWEDGITVVTSALRETYMDEWGAQNVYQIGSRYAADPNWANKVTHFMNEIEAFEKQEKNTVISISI